MIKKIAAIVPGPAVVFIGKWFELFSSTPLGYPEWQHDAENIALLISAFITIVLCFILKSASRGLLLGLTLAIRDDLNPPDRCLWIRHRLDPRTINFRRDVVARHLGVCVYSCDGISRRNYYCWRFVRGGSTSSSFLDHTCYNRSNPHRNRCLLVALTKELKQIFSFISRDAISVRVGGLLAPKAANSIPRSRASRAPCQLRRNG